MAQEETQEIDPLTGEEYIKTPLSIFGQIFRIIFYIFLLGLVWRFLPFSFKDVDLKDITEMIATILLNIAIIYSLFSPDKNEYQTWGRFGVWFVVGVGALYGISFLL